MKTIAYWIATFGGAGLSPKAPGTVGSLASLIIWAPLVFFGGAFLIPAVVFVTLIGVWSIHSSLSQFSGSDPQNIVIDEVAGMGIALLCCPPSWLYIFIGFALFRLFDVVKPWPVSLADQKIKGTWGIMLDDLLAGAYACLTLLLVMKIVKHYMQ